MIVEWSTVRGNGEVIAWVGRLDDGEFIIALEPPLELSVTPTEPAGPIEALVREGIEAIEDPEVGDLTRDEQGQTAAQRRASERLRRMAEGKVSEG